MGDAKLSYMKQSSSTPVKKIGKEWQSTPTSEDAKPVNKSQTCVDEMTLERDTRMARPEAKLAGQSDEQIIYSDDKKEPDKAVSDDASEISPSLQSLDDDTDDAPMDDGSPDEPPYQAPGEM